LAKTISLPTLERLHELFILDANAGVLIARTTKGKKVAGAIVGTPTAEGRLICRVDYKIYYVHRLIYKMSYGFDPPNLVDHRNRKVNVNCVTNLRDANTVQNGRNRNVNKNTKSGLKGAHWSTGEQKWRSSIKVNGKSYHLGWFNTKEEAHAAYVSAANERFGEFSSSAFN